MTILTWLAVSSLVWGGVIWFIARILQRSNGVSGRARQWIWRGATALLIAPWVAAPLVSALGLGLAPAEVAPVVAAIEEPMIEAHAAVFTGETVNVGTTAIENGGSLLAWISGLQWIETALFALIAGWLMRFVLAQLALRSLLGIVNNSRVAEAGVATMSLHGWTQRLGLRRAPRLRIVDQAVSPFSYGMFRPTICLPEGMERQLSREALDLVVGHECLHIARGDGWRRPLERIVADVFWFNPFAWAMRRELDIARELACDEGVVNLSSARHAYARTLRDVAGFSAGLSHAAPAASMSLAGGRSLMLRVTRTLSQAKRKPARAVVVAACVLGAIGAPIAVAQVMLATPRAPQPPAAPLVADMPAPPAAPAQVPVPPVAPVAEQNVYISPDGMVRASFSATVVSTSGAKGSYSVGLEGSGANGDSNVCIAQLDGLGDLNVAKDQSVARGDAIGTRGNSRSLSFHVQCTDELDGRGRPVFSAPPAPPAPAEAPEAPEAPEAAEAAESPEAPEAAAPAPFAPFDAWDAPRPLAAPHATPMTPLTTLTPPTPPTPPTPRTWVTPAPAPAAPLKGQRTPTAAPPAPGQHVTPPTPPEPIVLRAPFAARVMTIEPGDNGLSKVKLQQVATRAVPLEGEPCVVFYTGVENLRVVEIARVIGEGQVIGFATPSSNSVTTTCAMVKAAKVTPAPQPATSYVSPNTPHAVLNAGRPTSRFGERFDPATGKSLFHEGIDLAAPKGTAVHAPGDAQVSQTFAAHEKLGNAVELTLPSGSKIRMTHLDEVKVKTGNAVKAGDVVGTVGSTGLTTGPHVHLEVVVKGKMIDPELVRGLTLIRP